MASSFHIEHFGCRAARADGEAIAAQLRSAGITEGSPETADVVVVNTCSVTAEADRAARAFIRRANRQNPDARIVATGCYAQRAPEELASLPGVSAVIGNSHKALAPRVAVALTQSSHPAALVSLGALFSTANASQPLILADDRFAHSFLEEPFLAPGAQTRPNLKIQEGCGNRCSFCVIPQTRGGSRSLPAADILRHVESFVSAGGNELVLSGINLGRWGRDLSPSVDAAPALSGLTLSGLVGRIFAATDLPRLRLSSIEPMDWDADLIALMREFAGTRIARHAHLPLQSGSDTVLRRMHRRYRPWHYAEKVEALLSAVGPELTLGADVMAGFPGETDREFEETLDLIRSLPFGYLHLFPFSPRPGTRAWALHVASRVPAAAVDERMAALRSLAAEKSVAHRRRFIGRELDALTLHTAPSVAVHGRTSALTDNFLPVNLSASLAANRRVRIRVTAINAEGTLVAIPASSPTTSKRTALPAPAWTLNSPLIHTAP